MFLHIIDDGQRKADACIGFIGGADLPQRVYDDIDEQAARCFFPSHVLLGYFLEDFIDKAADPAAGIAEFGQGGDFVDARFVERNEVMVVRVLEVAGVVEHRIDEGRMEHDVAEPDFALAHRSIGMDLIVFHNEKFPRL